MAPDYIMELQPGDKLTVTVPNAVHPPPPPPPPSGLVFSTTIKDGDSLTGPKNWEATVTSGSAHHMDFFVNGQILWPEKAAPWGGVFDSTTLPDGPHVLKVVGYPTADNAVNPVTVVANVTVKNAVIVPAPPPAGTITAIASGPFDTKDNIQGRLNGNGNFAILVRKKGTGPITDVRTQTRYGTSTQVYHKGDGGLYAVTVHLGSINAPVVGQKPAWKPGVLSADAHFPEIHLDTPILTVADGVAVFVKFTNIHANPDGNYLSFNVLLDRDHSSPRQWAFADSDLAVYVDTGSGFVVRPYSTPMVDLLPGHEGFGYSSCLTQYWQPVGGSAAGRDKNDQVVLRGSASGNGVRESFHLDAAFTLDTIQTRLRRISGTGPVMYEIKRASDGTVIWSGLANSPVAPSPYTGQDKGGYGLFVAKTVLPVGLVPGDYFLELSSTGNTFTMTPGRKALKGTYPDLTADWLSFTAPGGAEYRYGPATSWTPFNGSARECDLQYAIFKAA